ncbi:molybdopterin molybdenumtransferase MoeA [Sagittula sp. NFXS13]|uniref:molybdenum cofactor synthesis domain-containing protein n=1 Tax=Sagittula sp. NFXS13 TaxID=2819095 RepID=UPI0032DEC870
MVDWSGGNDRGPRPKRDAIWIGEAGRAPVYCRNRAVAEAHLAARISDALDAGERLMVGFDFPFGYPSGVAQALCDGDTLALWYWLESRIEDSPKANNRFDLAAEINRRFPGQGPFWGNGLKRDIDGLPRTKEGYENPFSDKRLSETRAKGTFSVWQLAGAGSVGSQALMGLPVLARLRRQFPVAAWPLEPWDDAAVVFTEIWPGLIEPAVARHAGIRDAVQVRVLAEGLNRLSPARLNAMLSVDAPDAQEEGWILGLGHEKELLAAMSLTPPPLKNDCFALPPGVDWTPVDEALAMLQSRLTCVCATEAVALGHAAGRVLADDVTARRSNPPEPNTAVDGYGFAGASVGEGDIVLPLVDGRAAAGVPYAGTVPPGQACRVLTGAALPDGVDTVVLDEDCATSGGEVAFRGPVKTGSNTRRAGEDVQEGQTALSAGRRLAPADLALAAAVGLSDLPVRERLRVGVLSTGDEVVPAGSTAAQGQIYDANRPMLLSIADRLGHVAVDLGHVGDDRDALRARLDAATQQVDVVLTSGGASAGDEDHVSGLLRETGALAEWRIALKPGRPLALGMWQGMPIFGLPGNPVAAFVCTLVFARPAMGLMSGAGWQEPQGFNVPAAFSKRKKPGRREYLRARIRDGHAEVFKSEGSGRISGLSWAEGLVELPDGAQDIAPGTVVRYIPFGSFGL